MKTKQVVTLGRMIRLLTCALLGAMVPVPVRAQQDAGPAGPKRASRADLPPDRGAPIRLGAALPEGTRSFLDVPYVTNGHPRQRLDLYVPGQGSKFPLILVIHGGAFMGGDKRGENVAQFLKAGYAAASLNYRLSGDALFPAAVQDCKAAVRWLRANAATFNVDPDHFGAWGSSAGGNLVAMLGTTGETNLFDVGENLGVSSRVQAVADWFGPTDFLQMDTHRLPNGMGHDADASPESRYVGGPIQENKGKVAQANPITFITARTPPFVIAHGDQDPLVPHHQSELLQAALKAVGVSVTFHTVKGAGHGFHDSTADKLMMDLFARYLKTPAP